MTLELLDELVAKAPTVSANEARLDAATDYIERVRAAVAAVKSAVVAARAAIDASGMDDLRRQFASPRTAFQFMMSEEVCFVNNGNPRPQPQPQPRANSAAGRLKLLEKERREDIERTIREARDRPIAYFAELPPASTAQPAHAHSFSEPEKFRHIFEALDGAAVFRETEAALEAALLDVETRFSAQVIEPVTGDLRKAKKDVLFGMFSERSTLAI
jgi:hypothetical protein